MSNDDDLRWLGDDLKRRGVEAEHGPAEECILICMAVEDNPIPAVPSVFGDCDGGCGRRIYWSRLSVPAARRVCPRCARIEIVKLGDKAHHCVTPTTRAEVEAALGHKIDWPETKK